MAYKKPVKSYRGQIQEVTIGSGLKIGGESVIPFYSFDGDTGNKPAIGMEIWDIFPENWPEAVKDIFKDVADDPVKWAKFCIEEFKPDFICIRFKGANPDGEDRTPEQCAEVAKSLSEQVSIPLVIAGCENVEKNGKIFTKIAEEIGRASCRERV